MERHGYQFVRQKIECQMVPESHLAYNFQAIFDLDCVIRRLPNNLTATTLLLMAVHLLMSPLWRGPGNVHGFVLDGKSYQQG